MRSATALDAGTPAWLPAGLLRLDLGRDLGAVREDPALDGAQLLLEPLDPPLRALVALGGRRNRDARHQKHRNKMKTHDKSPALTVPRRILTGLGPA